MENKADIGIVGLAVMGENLVLNMESKGFNVSVYNRTINKVDNFIKGRANGKNIIGTYSVEEFVTSLKSPRKVMIMVKAGKPVDDFIEQVIPFLEKGDIIIDGGNSHFPDNEVRNRQILERIPAGRWGTCDDFKGPVVFLASEASNYVNGETILVDGGWMGR